MKLLRTAKDQQIDTLFINLEKENFEMLKKYDDRTPEQRNQRRQERMKKQLDKWIGDLTEEQLQALALWSERIDGTFTIWLDNRRHLQRLFHNLLADQRSHIVSIRSPHLFYMKSDGIKIARQNILSYLIFLKLT